MKDDKFTLTFYFYDYKKNTDVSSQKTTITLIKDIGLIRQEFSIKDQWSTWSGIWQTVKPDVIKGEVGMMILSGMFFSIYILNY